MFTVKRCVMFAVGMGCYLGAESLLAAQDGIGVAGGITVIGQAITDKKLATNDPGNAATLDDGIAMTYSFDLEFEKKMASGTALVYLIGAEGDPVYDGANADAEGTFSQGNAAVAEAWYGHDVGDWLTLTLGKIDPTRIYDANEVANDQTTQFLANGFVNNPAILFPSYTPGVNLTFHLGDPWDIHFGVFEEEVRAGNTKIQGEMQHKFFIGEVDFNFRLFDQEANIRFTGWDSDHSKKSGFALNLDQAVGEMVTLFSRIGVISGAKDAATASAFSLGGRLAFDEGHTVGIAYLADIPEGSAFATRSVFETYVSFQVAEATFFSLDAQFVANPGYDKDAKSVSILGFRAQANF